MTSLIGCCDSLYLKPCAGSISFGAVISTPAMGPATEGLRGLELFLASHPVNAKVSVAQSAAAAVFFMIKPRGTSFGTRARVHGRQPRADTLSAEKDLDCRGVRLLGYPE